MNDVERKEISELTDRINQAAELFNEFGSRILALEETMVKWQIIIKRLMDWIERHDGYDDNQEAIEEAFGEAGGFMDHYLGDSQ